MNWSEEPIYFQGTLEELMSKKFNYEQDIKFNCSKCGKEEVIKYRILQARYSNHNKKGISNDTLLCHKCSRSEANHPHMIPYSVEPIRLEEDLDKYKFNQKLIAVCPQCGKEFVKTRINLGKEFICESCKTKNTLLQRYGREYVNQDHIPLSTYEIINNKDKLLEFINNHPKQSAPVMSKELGIGAILFRKKLSQFDIDYPAFSRSLIETEVCEYLDNLGIKYNTNVKIIPPYEVDIYIPDKNIAIEVNGNYWHSIADKDKFYHQHKSLLCKEKGIRLIHIFEYEWVNNNEKIKQFLKDNLGVDIITVGARKCQVCEINKDAAEDFFNKSHLQNYGKSSVRLGLYYKGKLLSAMTFSKSRFNKKYEWEIIRYATFPGYRIIGGASKLFSFFKERYQPKSVLSYCDLSKMSGEVYKKLGFKEVGLTEPGYVWVKNNSNEVLTRYQTQVKKLKLLGFEGTEDEIMSSQNFFKIYNSGNLIYEYIQ